MLSDMKVRTLKPATTPYKVTDRDGLYLLVTPRGSRWWRYDYRHRGKRKTISLGVYPDVPLAKARERLRLARVQVADGIDPSATRRAETRRQIHETTNTFAAVAREWLDKHRAKLAPATVTKIEWLFEGYLFPRIGSRSIGTIEPPDLLEALQRIEARGRFETTHRAKQISGQVFRYAIATGRATRDPSGDLRGALAPVVIRHHAAVVAPVAIGELLRAIESFTGSFPVWQALRLAPLVFVRPGELRKAEWTEFDIEDALWRIPAERMKMRTAHLVPLATQTLTILRELRPLTGRGVYVFPSNRTTTRPMSDNTLNAALRRLGYGHRDMTAHGFRSMASTRLNEMGYRPDLIERQLAHAEKDTVRAAYNRAEFLEERRAMMQAWADELDRLRDSAPLAVAR
jgi:integrase